MILPNDEECVRVIKELENEPTLTEWETQFITSNLFRTGGFTDRQKETIAQFRAKYDV